MADCLIILQPRQIERCLASLEALPVDKVWFQAFGERQLVEPLNRFMRDTRYDNYLLVADDVIATVRAFEVVVDLLRTHDGATGYCRLSQDSPWLNVTRGPLRLSNGQIPVLGDYDFYHLDEVAQFAVPEFRTWFGGWALTGLRRDLWLEFPFRVNQYTGMQSDFESFIRLQRPIACHRDAFIDHQKPHVTGICDENVLVGQAPPRIIYRRWHG